jgi:hypothetical protein
MFRNGIYTPHKEKLFKLKNGFFILYLHRQAVSVTESHLIYLDNFCHFDLWTTKNLLRDLTER